MKSTDRGPSWRSLTGGVLGVVSAVVAVALSGCGPTIKHEVKPIHVTMDVNVNVNVKVDRQLDDLFAFEDAIEAKVVGKEGEAQ